MKTYPKLGDILIVAPDVTPTLCYDFESQMYTLTAHERGLDAAVARAVRVIEQREDR